MKQEEINAALNEQYNIINEREAKLRATDYVAVKIAEGKATKTEYKDQIAERQVWRDDINAAQQRIAELLEEAPEEEDFAERDSKTEENPNT